MRKLFLIIILIFPLILWSQKKEYTPRILFLNPHEFSYDEYFKKDLLDAELKMHDSKGFRSEISNQPENIQRSLNSIIDFTATTKVEGIIPLMILDKFMFTMFRGDRNFIVLADTLSVSGSANELKELAEKMDVEHIVYFPKVSFYKEGEIQYAYMQMAMYDRHTGKMSLWYENTEDSVMEEGEEETELKYVESVIDLCYNVTLHARNYLMERIRETNPEILKSYEEYQRREAEEEFPDFGMLAILESEPEEKELLSAKMKQLANLVKTPFTTREKIQDLISSNKFHLSTEGMYQAIFKDDDSRFVAFVVEPVSSDKQPMTPVFEAEEEWLKENHFWAQKKGEDAFIGSFIRGYKDEDDGWFIDKWPITEMHNTTLEQAQQQLMYYLYFMDYYEFGSRRIKTSNEFWSDHYEKTDKYSMFHNFEQEFGLPNHYRLEGQYPWDAREKGLDRYMDFMPIVQLNHCLREVTYFESTFFEQLPKLKEYDYSITAQHLIYNANRDIVIYPVFSNAENGEKVLRLIVHLNKDNKIYEWLQFTPLKIDASKNVEHIIEEFMQSRTTFFMEAYPVIRDIGFWEKMVIQKEGENYTWLKSID